MTSQTKIKIASVVFFIITILYFFGLFYDDKIAFVTKPLLMVSIAIIYLVSVKKPSFWYVSALFFSFWGDALLLFKDKFFVYGLASFLLAHVLYIKITISFLKKVKLQKLLLASFPFVMLFIALFYIIYQNLEEMLIPVIVYGITISCFGIVALLNYLQEKNTENLWLFLGAFFFIISDSILAINKFYETREFYSISIMITYILAQYLICKALVVKTKNG